MSQEFQQPQFGAKQAEQQQYVLVNAAQLMPAPSQADSGDDDAMSIDLMELFYHVMGKIKYVILAALVGTLLAGCYAFFLATPTYQATSKLYIMTQDGITLDMADLNIGAALTMDYQEVFKTWEVHEMVRSMLQLDYSYTQLQSMLTVSNPNDTRLLYITVRNSDAQLATDLANAYATAAKTFIYQTMETAEPNDFSIALVPSNATGMSKTRYLMLGFIMGVVLSGAIIVLQFIMDDRPHTPDDITKVAGIPTLAVVPREPGVAKTSQKSKKHRKERNA